MKSLERCVNALLAVSTRYRWEIIIVDNDSTDATAQFLKTLHNREFGNVSFISAFEANRGSSSAKNRGCRMAASPIIAFTDDDCYVDPRYIDSIVAVFDENPDAAFLGGRILLYDSSDLRLTIEESSVRRIFKPRSFLPAGAIQGANMAFRKSSLEAVGGFDERFGAGTPYSCEDLDVAAALLWSSSTGVYDPRPVVYHHHGRKTKLEAVRLIRSYDAGRGAYYMKYAMQRQTRLPYTIAWLKSIIKDVSGALRGCYLPRQTFREIRSGLRFLLLTPKSPHGMATMRRTS